MESVYDQATSAVESVFADATSGVSSLVSEIGSEVGSGSLGSQGMVTEMQTSTQGTAMVTQDTVTVSKVQGTGTAVSVSAASTSESEAQARRNKKRADGVLFAAIFAAVAYLQRETRYYML